MERLFYIYPKKTELISIQRAKEMTLQSEHSLAEG